MSKRKSESWKDTLNPFAEAIESIEVLIEKMSDEELVKLERAIDEPTQTNCGWSTYRAAQYLEANCYQQNVAPTIERLDREREGKERQ